MKICWDNLEEIYLSTQGNLRHNNTTYIEVEHCEVCGNPFLQASSQKNNYCSLSCARADISDECREKISIKMSGENNPMYGVRMTGDKHWNWKGGISADSRSTPAYNLWRDCVYGRDYYTCQMCGTTKSGCFNAHHIFKWTDYPEFRFEVWNGITLCEECHRKVYNKEELYIEQFLKLNFKKEN